MHPSFVARLGPHVLAAASAFARAMLVNVPVAWLGGRLFSAYGVFLGVCVSNLLVGSWTAWWMWHATVPDQNLAH